MSRASDAIGHDEAVRLLVELDAPLQKLIGYAEEMSRQELEGQLEALAPDRATVR